jgi:hypothetical protein
MIVKYLKDDVWGYIDNVRQVANKNIDNDKLIKAYDECEDYKDITHSGEKDIASYVVCGEGQLSILPKEIIASNKIYLMAIADQSDWGHNVHTENLIDGTMALENYPTAVILLYVEEHKEYDSIALVTNQKCYLMNDKGQTIERLV